MAAIMADRSASLKGSCHCGAVVISVPADTDFLAAGRCDCSLCRRRWAPTASVNLSDLSVLDGQEALTLYQFNTHVAEHYFCKICGTYMFHRRRSDPNEYGFNVGCFDGVDMKDYQTAPIFDGVNHPSDLQPETPSDMPLDTSIHKKSDDLND